MLIAERTMQLTIYLSLILLVLYLLGLAVRRRLFLRDKARMERESRRGGRVIARVEEMQPGSVKKFWLICQKYRVDAFLINYEGKFHAYVNRCRHIPISMDWVDNDFFTEDKRYLVCANHGATYEPETGECVWGPCFGAFLQDVPLEISDGKILAYCPEDPEDGG